MKHALTILAALAIMVFGGAATATAGALLDGSDIQNESLTGKDIDFGTLTGADVKNETIESRDLAPNSVTAQELAPDAAAGLLQQSDLGVHVLPAGGDVTLSEPRQIVSIDAFFAGEGTGEVLVTNAAGEAVMRCVVAPTCSSTRVLPGGVYHTYVTGAPNVQLTSQKN